MVTYFERFSIRLTQSDALAASHPGPCDEDVAALLRKPYVRRQLDKLNPELIRAELRDYGAWDSDELSDDEENRMRIVWIAAGNIREDARA